MADYNIKVSGKTGGMGGGAGKKGSMESAMSARQKAIEASKKNSGGDGSNKLLESNKLLTKSIEVLTKEIKALQGVIKSKGLGGGGGGGSGSPFGGAGEGLEGIGEAIPIVGAGVIIAGWTLKKINEIGNAYLDKTAEQLGNVGVTNSRRGSGLFNASEVGVGMKAYAGATGRFAHNVTTDSVSDALNIGSIYGLGSEEVLGAAGTFNRAGGKYENVATVALGGGVESQLPILISAMASEMEDAFKNGIDASDMAKNMSEKMTALTMASRTKDSNLAIAIAKAATGSKANAGKGVITSMQDVMTWRAGQEKMVSDFNDKDFIYQEVQSGRLGSKKAAELLKLKEKNGSLSRSDIEGTLGATMSTAYAEDSVSKLGLAETQQSLMRQLIQIVNPSGKMKEDDLIAALKVQANGYGLNFGGEGNAGIETTYRSLSEKPDIESGRTKKDSLLKQVDDSDEAWAKKNNIERENFLLQNGREFAKITLEIESVVRTFAQEGISGATESLKLLTDTAKETATTLKDTGAMIQQTTNEIMGSLKDMANRFYDYVTK